jgi:hypothetical protein
MIGQNMRVFALSSAFAIFLSASPASAASHDGAWNMSLVTTSGHCGKFRIGLAVNRGRIRSTSGRFFFHPVSLRGRVTPAGRVVLEGVAGPRQARGAGRFLRARGSGSWSGTGPSGVCSGVWSASRS